MLRSGLVTVRAAAAAGGAGRPLTTAAASASRGGLGPAVVTALGASAAAVVVLVAGNEEAHASSALEPAHFPWSHYGVTSGFDHAAIRRGFEVYKNVCSSCHGLERLAYRNLVGVAFTEEEAKAIAAERSIEDGPDDQGNRFMRPAKLADYIKGPYANEVKARKANNGALPPDLSVVIKGRHDHEDYVFSLLTGYREPPAGISVAEPLHYNPYFPGSKIAMAQALFDGAVNYEDGTPATVTQMAKDVTTFLAWAAEPETDERKRMGIKVCVTLAFFTVAAVWWKRFKWAPLKNRVLVYKKM